MDTVETSLTRAFKLIKNIQKVADACKVTHQSASRWRDNGYLPRTEITGETKYGRQIEKLCGGQITHRQLLRENKSYRASCSRKLSVSPRLQE